MKVHLRPVEREDLDWILHHRNNPLLCANFNQPTPLSYEQQVIWYEKEILPKKTLAYVVTLNGLKIGYIALQNINWITRSAEVSHFINPEYDKIFANIAHSSIIYIAFKSLNLNRIHSICFDINPLYQDLLNLGFKSEGVARQVYFKDGKYGNGHYVAILKEDYEKGGSGGK